MSWSEVALRVACGGLVKAISVTVSTHTEAILRREAKDQGRTVEALAASAVEEAANRMNFSHSVDKRVKK
jgi:hypothetical protein